MGTVASLLVLLVLLPTLESSVVSAATDRVALATTNSLLSLGFIAVVLTGSIAVSWWSTRKPGGPQPG